MRFFLVGLIIVVLSACLSEPNCLVTTSNQVKIAFKRADKDTAKVVFFPRITASGTDAVFKADTATGVILYANPGATQTTYKFYTKDNHVDSLTLSYKIQNVVISPECGAFPFYSNLKIVAYTFSDTVRVVNPQLSNLTTVTNVEVRF